MKTIPKICPVCNQEFNALIKEINRGNAKVCSRKCARDNAKKASTKFNLPNVYCSYCKKEFYISQSKLKNSKSGLYFCCRQHKDMAQRLNSGFSVIWPSHYKNGKYINYRKLALEHYGKFCQVCGYNKSVSVLQVHHKDQNRENNCLDNLLVCCPTCHVEKHILHTI